MILPGGQSGVEGMEGNLPSRKFLSEKESGHPFGLSVLVPGAQSWVIENNFEGHLGGESKCSRLGREGSVLLHRPGSRGWGPWCGVIGVQRLESHPEEPGTGALESLVAGALSHGNLKHNQGISFVETWSRVPGVLRMAHQGEKTLKTVYTSSFLRAFFV